MELATKAKLIFHKFKYVSGLCVSSFLGVRENSVNYPGVSYAKNRTI